MSELLPCPMCGGSASIGTYEESARYGIGCDHCFIAFPYVFDSQEHAITAWNRRTPTDLGRLAREVADTAVARADAFKVRRDAEAHSECDFPANNKACDDASRVFRNSVDAYRAAKAKAVQP